MKPNQISPVVVTFKALPDVRLVAVKNGAWSCADCRLNEKDGLAACTADQDCAALGFHYEEVQP